jgi:hypothetical protein
MIEVKKRAKFNWKHSVSFTLRAYPPREVNQVCIPRLATQTQKTPPTRGAKLIKVLPLEVKFHVELLHVETL